MGLLKLSEVLVVLRLVLDWRVEKLFQVFLFRLTLGVLYPFELLAAAADPTSDWGLAKVSRKLLLLDD